MRRKYYSSPAILQTEVWLRKGEHMTNFEKAFAKMTPAERKKKTEAISNMMGMPPKKKKPATKKKKK